MGYITLTTPPQGTICHTHQFIQNAGWLIIHWPVLATIHLHTKLYMSVFIRSTIGDGSKFKKWVTWPFPARPFKSQFIFCWLALATVHLHIEFEVSMALSVSDIIGDANCVTWHCSRPSGGGGQFIFHLLVLHCASTCHDLPSCQTGTLSYLWNGWRPVP